MAILLNRKKSEKIVNDEGKITFDAVQKTIGQPWEVKAYCDNATLAEGLTEYLHTNHIDKIRQGSSAILTNGLKVAYICDGSENWHKVIEGGGGGDAEWGAITGDISTQADLIALLTTMTDFYKTAGYNFNVKIDDTGSERQFKFEVKDANGNYLLDKAINATDIFDAIKDLPEEINNKIIDAGTF